MPETLETQHVRFEITCFLRLTPAGSWEINYSHHSVFARDGSTGPFASESRHRAALDATLKGIILLGVFQEVWSCFEPTIKVLDVGMDTPIGEVQW
jgi:hypothetical protein